MADACRRSSIVRGLVAVVLALTATGLLAGPASAHAALISSDPADGATVDAPPTSITLTFDEALLADTETISINDENGNVVASQQATPDGHDVSVPWPAELVSGTYQVAYRVVSGDGHPVMGAITFSIASGGSSADPAPASPSPTAAATPPHTSASVSATPTATPAESGSSGVAVALVILGSLAVLGIIVFVAVTMIRRRRT
jgi:methionine-rich copper-binding protein CopC